MTTLPPYPAYKDSGVPWLGRIPAHWELIPNRVLVRQRKRLVGPQHTEFQLLSLTKQGVIIRDLSVLKGKFSSDMGTSQEVLPGDLVFCLFDVPETPRTVGLSRYRGMITGAYTVLEAMGSCSKEFFEAFYVAMDDQKLLSPLYSGLRNTIPPSVFLHAKTPVPPPAEQHAITRYLDHMDRRIRRYIRAKQRLIALLEEQKRAIIHQAVTRGLDPAVRLKPSGVAWLGDVPEHWEVKCIKYLLREVDHRSTTGQETLLSLRTNHGLVPHDEHFSRPGQASTLVGYKLVRPGQVVLNRLQANNGLVFASDVFGVVSPDYAVFDAITDVDLHYLTTLFRIPTMKHKFRVESKGLGTGTAGFLRLYTDRFGMIAVPLPPRDEQSRIMAVLDTLLSGIRSTSDRVQREIALLREYRTRLLADVVTGQVDVRAAAVGLAEEAEETATLDEVGALDEDEDGEALVDPDEEVDA